MVNTKQMARKENPGQSTPARFPQGGKPGGKAAKHMMAAQDDGNNNQVRELLELVGDVEFGEARCESTNIQLVWLGSTGLELVPLRRFVTIRKNMELFVAKQQLKD